MIGGKDLNSSAFLYHRYEASIGVLKLRQYILNLTWKKYQDDIPQILKRLRANKAETEHRLQKVQAQLGGLNAVKLRSIASDYVVDFLQLVDRLLAGTSEGNPAVNGQTLEEEKTQFGSVHLMSARFYQLSILNHSVAQGTASGSIHTTG